MRVEPDRDQPARRALVVGSSGGIGAALVRVLASRGYIVEGLSRSGSPPVDITDEDSIAMAAEQLRPRLPYQIILVATGLLHDAQVSPEKTYRNLSSDSLLRYFAVNSVGPALVAKHFIPLLPKRGRSVFAVLSARVGSISDNRLGGWYGYRASKAALNMLVKTLSVELQRVRPDAICVSLHPGTVETGLSRPYSRGVAPERLFTAEFAANALVERLDRLTPADSGYCYAWDGHRIDA